MGVYLNSKKPYLLFQEDSSSTYFVDKTEILKELVPLVELKENIIEKSEENGGKGHKYVCITRPRRFGKTVMANMISSYFGKGVDSSQVFGRLAVSGCDWYEKHLNKHNVIHIMFNEMPKNCKTYQQYIDRIEARLISDLVRTYPDAHIGKDDALWDAFNNIVEFVEEEKFIFILDEWDFIFHQDFATDEDKESYTKFLSILLKDQPYVELAYMTGILPIAKYSSGSELNMFYEYTMASEEKFSDSFGFTESETDGLYKKYLLNCSDPKVTREGLRIWYDGYHTRSKERIYNPRSVVASLLNNNLGNYWTSSGPYDEIFYYIEKNVDDVRDGIALMVSGEPVPAKVQEYAHNTEVPLLSYSNEADLTAVVNLVYLAARDFYRIEREDKAGLGYVDFIFYPLKEGDDCIILELKVDHTAEEAIQQIKDKKYALKFQGKMGDRQQYTGRILGVGIAYSKEDKKHSCKIEELREQINEISKCRVI
ncbi:MAG: AAA family ATPase [Lachnospiraceae bacterium]|nr:AAA family ATPase [Lachnospiraceae bacterium]MBQ8230598.1 AAA family ATPase [Lachnospiraceae bacterium]